MYKIIEFKKEKKYNNILTESFRRLVESEIGKLDTAKSFMYLYRRFGEPKHTNNDDYKILYEYWFQHEDILIEVHASYKQWVFFSLHIPEERVAGFYENRKLFWHKLYGKYNTIPFSPYSMISYEMFEGATKEQKDKNWKLTNASAKAFFTEEEFDYVTNNKKEEEYDDRKYRLLSTLGKKQCDDFRAQLNPEELLELNHPMPLIDDIEGLKAQCEYVINEFKKGIYVRDVAFNIMGYEDEKNNLTEAANINTLAAHNNIVGNLLGISGCIASR